MNVNVVCSSDIDSCKIEALLREIGYEVVCVTTDVGQVSGDSQYVEKEMTEYVKDYVYPCLGDGAVYERKYLSPVIIKAMGDVGPYAVDYEYTGKGNDQGDIMWDPAYEPNKEMYMMLIDPEDAPCIPKYPAPVSIHGKVLVPAILLSDINDNGGTILADSWFDILRKSMDALMENVTETTGLVTVKVYKGIVREDTLSSENGQGNA